jgi:cytochrome c
MIAFALAALLATPSPSVGADRPRDIWVFRSVLDQRARMVTIGLHDDLWVAYDATNCGIYKVWNGGVKFDGAVYTTVHGPQPTSLGEAYRFGALDEPVWNVFDGTKTTKVKPRFRGYRFIGTQVRLQYEFDGLAKKAIWAYETPEFERPGAGKVALRRSFEFKDLPTGWRVFPSPLVQDREGKKTMISGAEKDAFEKAFALKLVGDASNFKAEASGGQPATGTFRSEFDSVGKPPEELDQLQANNEPMPDFQQEEQTQREPGLAFRLYWFNKEIPRLPVLVEGQTPNVSKVVPNINFSTTEQFGGPEDNFLVHLTGYLKTDVTGDYKFRLSSDDGSRFSIRDEIIIDNDGLHGDTSVEGAFRLTAGENPILVEYFESGADNVLRLEWMKPGSTTWEIIPESAFSTVAGEVHVTAPGEKAVMDPDELKRPGDGRPEAGVHPSYDLYTVRPSGFQPRVGGIDFLPDGRMVICNWEPDGGVYVLSNVLGDAKKSTVKRIGAGLAEPLGIKVVNGDIYVLQKQELTKLIDNDKDGMIDEYYCVANGWGVTANFHEFAFGLVYDKGYFYGNLATAINPGGSSTHPQNKDRGQTVKIDAKTGDYKLITKGLRTPNGIGFGAFGKMYIADNQGDWLPASKILLVREGAFFNNRSVDPEESLKWKVDPPVVWLPQGEIGNSPSQPAPMNDGPYKGQMIHGDVTHGGVKRVFVEEVGGLLQGCVFRFTQGLEAGINRICWGPDGALYVGGIGSTGNWGQEGKEKFGLQKIKYNGKSTFEMLAVRAKTNGMEITLTEPLAPSDGNYPSDYAVSQWTYTPTNEYGGPKINPGKLPVKSVTVSRDRKKVFLELEGMKEGYVVYIKCATGTRSADGDTMWSTEAWYTLNKIPVGQTVKPAGLNEPAMNTLTAAEKTAGWKLLFDGQSAAGSFRAYNGATLPEAWVAKNGELTLDPTIKDATDITTKEEYADFEFAIDWKMSRKGNSGIMYRVKEVAGQAAYVTGPEYQLLDNKEADDNKTTLTWAAANYALIAPTPDVCNPAGEWNRAMIRVKGNHVEHWLNGFKVVEYELESPEWLALVAKSKFAKAKDYGRMDIGRIVLQNHGYKISFRNIKIRKI